MSYKQKYPNAYEQGRLAGQGIINTCEPLEVRMRAAGYRNIQNVQLTILRTGQHANGTPLVGVEDMEWYASFYEGILSCFD